MDRACDLKYPNMQNIIIALNDEVLFADEEQ